MVRIVRQYRVEIVSFLVLGLFFYFVTSGVPLIAAVTEWTRQLFLDDLQTFSTIFLSLFIEGLPFILLGVLLSSVIHLYVNEETVHRLFPRHPALSIPLAAVFGLLMPICECGIVPVVRRLVQKGLPAYAAFTFLLAVPIVNPITIVSTYIAFGNSWEMALSRTGLGALVAVVMGVLFYFFFRHQPVLKTEPQVGLADGDPVQGREHGHHSHTGDGCGSCSEHAGEKKSKSGQVVHALYHATFEFIDMGKYFILGALIAAAFQTFVGVAAIREFAANTTGSLLLMMGLAFGLSICSSADAFLAASFRSVLGTSALLGFLVYGPMVDIKNVLMMAGGFRWKVILFFVIGTTAVTLLSILTLF